MSEERGSIWEDGIGRRDEDARVHWEAETTHVPDPQAVRYGEGRCRVVVQATTGGPVFRHRAHVDVYWHEGLRPSYIRLTPDEARRIAAMLETGASRAEEGTGPPTSGA
ncbi:MAG: hypothetical protein RIB67_01860 [Miltoncostaeaceae bacterium]